MAGLMRGLPMRQLHCSQTGMGSTLLATGTLFALAFFAGSVPCFGQRLSFGMVGGTSVTKDFRIIRNPFSVEGKSYLDLSESGPRTPIFGPMMDVGLSRSWSVEVNALHRSLKYRVTSDVPGRICGGNTFCGGSVSTWQFPVLVKYRIPLERLKPFAAVGPSFRTHSTPIGSRPSSYGITAGAGIEVKAGRFYFAPTVRYTRWGGDGLPFRPTFRDQVEVLGGIGYRTDAGTRKAFGRKVWLGLVAGVPLTNDFPPGLPGSPTYTGEARRFANFRSAAGLIAEVEVTRRLSIEVNGLYRRLHFENAPEVVVTWQFPVLAKYTFENAPLRPFVAVGPSFRATGNLNYTNPAHIGLTTGAGWEARWSRLRVTPTLRYTRWAEDNSAPYASQNFTKRDQLELLFGFSF